MILTAAPLHVLFLVVSATATAVLATYAWHRRAEPGVLPFAALMAATTVWSASYAVGLITLNPTWRPFWEAVQWFGIATVPVWFVLFALEYTGHDRLVTRQGVAALLALPVVTLALVWSNPLHGLMWVENRVVVADGLALMLTTFGPWFWVYLAYAYVMILAGAGLLVRLVLSSRHLFAGQSVLLLVGTIAPVIGNAVSVFVSTDPLPGIDLTPYAFAVTGLTFGYALFRQQLFDLIPATRQLGRSAAIRDLEDGLLIVDTERRVIYCNPAAAELFDCDPTAVLGEPTRSLVEAETLDFDTEDALAELDRGDAVYEVRTSPITDRRDQLIGHTLVVSDVTERKRRERRLATQRDELMRLEELNAVVRSVNRALVSARTREEIEQAVCERLAAADRYRAVCAADIPTWEGTADRWTVAGADPTTTTLPAEQVSFDAAASTVHADTDGSWTVVPLADGRTVYGALGVRAAEGVEALLDREREVLSELGELIGQAINAVENRELLAGDSVVEIEFRSRDAEGTLLDAAATVDCRLELAGLVPDAGEGHLAYLRVAGAPAAEAAAALEAAVGSDARPIGDADGSLVEWVAPPETLVGLLAAYGGNVLEATADGDATRVVVEVASNADVRALTRRVGDTVDQTQLTAKRERARPPMQESGVGDSVPDLTDRQREALEVAYRAGYFDWPRESTAEEIADSLDIAAPTLHAHLRKAEGTLLSELFEDATDS